MILISSSQSDYSTTKVIDYLVINKAKFLLLNENSKIENLDVQFVDNHINIRFEVDKKNYYLSDIKSYWYRKAGMGFMFLNNNKIINKNNNNILNGVIKHLINEEQNTIEFYLSNKLSDRTLGNYNFSNANHLLSLENAVNIGLKIPNTITTSNRNVLFDFFKKNKGQIISKGVQDILSFNTETKGFHFKTEIVKEEDILEMSDSFYFSPQ